MAGGIGQGHYFKELSVGAAASPIPSLAAK